MKREKTVDFHLKWAWHAISRMYNAYAAQEGLTMATGYVLLNIDLEHGTPATKIAPSIGMEARSLTRMLKSLEEKDWIRREGSENDKRFVRVFLTEEGKAKRAFAREGVIRFNQAIREHIPLEKLAIFLEVIQSVSTFVEDQNNKIKSEAAGQDLDIAL